MLQSSGARTWRLLVTRENRGGRFARPRAAVAGLRLTVRPGWPPDLRVIFRAGLFIVWSHSSLLLGVRSTPESEVVFHQRRASSGACTRSCGERLEPRAAVD